MRSSSIPDLGEAHVAQGMLEFYFEWNWPATEREFRRAVALNPSDPHAHHMYANYLTAMGRMDEALAERRRALALDPLSIRTGILLGRDYLVAGRYEEAIGQFRRMIEIDSTSPLALGIGQEGSFGLGDVYVRQGKEAEAFAEYLRGARLEGMTPAQLSALREAFETGGLRGVLAPSPGAGAGGHGLAPGTAAGGVDVGADRRSGAGGPLGAARLRRAQHGAPVPGRHAAIRWRAGPPGDQGGAPAVEPHRGRGADRPVEAGARPRVTLNDPLSP